MRVHQTIPTQYAARLGANYQIDTQIYHIRKARYAALARGEQPAEGLPKGAPQKPNGALDWFLKGLESYRRAEQAARRQEIQQLIAEHGHHGIQRPDDQQTIAAGETDALG